MKSMKYLLHPAYNQSHLTLNEQNPLLIMSQITYTQQKLIEA